MRVLIAVATLALAACGQPADTTAPPAEVAAAPEAPAPTPTVVMLTEADARSRIEGAGYTNVTALMQDTSGHWTATATQNGATVQVALDDAGTVTLMHRPG